MSKILFTVNFDGFFLSHRLPIALEAKKMGYDVIILCENTGKADIFIEHGFQYIALPFNRERKINILSEIKYIFFLYQQYKKIKPDIVHQISIRPVIYGSLVAKLLRNKVAVINAFSGMGYLFTNSRKRVSEFFLIPFFRYVFKQSRLKIIVQNNDDYSFFLQKKIANKSQLELIKGSGVDLEKFMFCPINRVDISHLRILFPARMLRDKGVLEFYAAAKIIKKAHPRFVFTLCGDIDKANPSSLSIEQLKKWNVEGVVKWIGYQKDMAKIIADHDIVILPSYREGLPKSLIEACAIGRPIITTDTNGCRECVIQNYNGFLVPAKDHVKIVEAINNFIQAPKLLNKFSANSRLLAEAEFDIKFVLTKTMSIYNKFKQ